MQQQLQQQLQHEHQLQRPSEQLRVPPKKHLTMTTIKVSFSKNIRTDLGSMW